MTLIKTCDLHKTMYYRECRECNADVARAEKSKQKANAKRAKLLSQAKEKQAEPRTRISKNPKKWGNKFLCSDGTKIGQSEIDERLKRHYAIYDHPVECEGCKRAATSHAHIIAKARCKQIGKTELIFNRGNWFFGCYDCNAAIENPKGKAWRGLLNINYCLSFIKQHDPELFAKFENAAIDQTKPII